MVHRIEFKNNKNQTLRGLLHVPKKYGTAVIFLHGFPSRINGFTGRRMTRAFSKTNFLFLAFDFSGTDTSDGRFEDKLVSQEVKEIKCAIDFLEKNYSFKKLILLGHSTGAINAALYAHTDNRVDAIILIGGSGDLKRSVQHEFTPLQVRKFWTKGYATYDNPEKWYHQKKIKKCYYDEFFTLDVLGSLHKFTKPVLIIHGEKDEAIPLRDARELFNAARRPKKLLIIKEADHRFTNHFSKLTRQIKLFLKKV